MLHIVDQYKKTLMAGIANYLVESTSPVEASPRPKERPALPEDGETIKGVTKLDLQNLDAAKQVFDAGKSIDKTSSKQAITDIQEIFVYLGYDLGNFGSNKNGVDGDFGRAMTQVVKDFQLDNKLPETGVVDKSCYDAMLALVNQKGGVSAQEASTGKESLSSSKVDATLNDYSGKALANMSDFEKKALQRDINTLLEKAGKALISVDGKVGKGTLGAMTDLGYNEQSLIVLRNESQKARNEKSLEASSKSIADYPSEKSKVDATLANLSRIVQNPERFSQIISELGTLTNVDNWGDEGEKNQRRVVAQYITDSLAKQVDAGMITALQASQVIEGLLAQEKFKSAPDKGDINRMVSDKILKQLAEATGDESKQEIKAILGKDKTRAALLRSKEPMDMGVSLERGFFKVAGQEYDIDRAEDMFIVTGNGIQRVGIRDTGALRLTNVAIVGNVLVGLMGNGCEGNVVYIPLDTNPVKPKPKLGKKPEPKIPSEPVIPEGPKRIIKNRWCHPRTKTYWIQWGYEGIPGGESVDTGEKCDTGGGGDGPGPGGQTSNPGVEGGGDNGGGGHGGGNDDSF